MDYYRIVLADDHVLLRQGLSRIIEGTADLKVVGEAGDGLELMSLLKTVVPDMVILDISMPHLRGLEAARLIKEKYPEAKVLILTMHKDAEYVSRAFSAGADGYLVKEDADHELFSAVEKIRAGGHYLSPRLSEGLAEEWVRIQSGDQKLLTAREKEVLRLIVEGNSNKEIADILFISVRTVERHRANIMDKLNLKNTADLIKYGIREGLF
jgi:DNA-binding NarL/FixJ family response regulator